MISPIVLSGTIGDLPTQAGRAEGGCRKHKADLDLSAGLVACFLITPEDWPGDPLKVAYGLSLAHDFNPSESVIKR
jgi:hypothetical protein